MERDANLRIVFQLVFGKREKPHCKRMGLQMSTDDPDQMARSQVAMGFRSKNLIKHILTKTKPFCLERARLAEKDSVDGQSLTVYSKIISQKMNGHYIDSTIGFRLILFFINSLRPLILWVRVW